MNEHKLLPLGLDAWPLSALVHGLPVAPGQHAQEVDVLGDGAPQEEGGGEVLELTKLGIQDAPLTLHMSKPS